MKLYDKGELYRDGIFIRLRDNEVLGSFLFQVNVLPSYSEELQAERLAQADRVIELWNQSLKKSGKMKAKNNQGGR